MLNGSWSPSSRGLCIRQLEVGLAWSQGREQGYSRHSIPLPLLWKKATKKEKLFLIYCLRYLFLVNRRTREGAGQTYIPGLALRQVACCLCDLILPISKITTVQSPKCRYKGLTLTSEPCCVRWKQLPKCWIKRNENKSNKTERHKDTNSHQKSHSIQVCTSSKCILLRKKPTEQLRPQFTPEEIVSMEDLDANFKISLLRIFSIYI